MRWTEYLATLPAETARALVTDLTAACTGLVQLVEALDLEMDLPFVSAALATAAAAFTAVTARLPAPTWNRDEGRQSMGEGDARRSLLVQLHMAVHQAHLAVEAILRDDGLEEMTLPLCAALVALQRARRAAASAATGS